jgi:Fungal chitosanase of glycosyl hydrolase group 75
MIRNAIATVAAVVLLAAPARADDKVKFFEVNSNKGHKIAYRIAGHPEAFFYRTNFVTDWDGSPWAYHPKGKKGGALDYTDNAGKPGNWYGVVTHNGKKDGNPVVQGSEHPAPGFYISPTALADKTKKPADPRRYVDAKNMPYVSLPPKAQYGTARGFNKEGAHQGDFCSVVNMKNDKVVHAIVADSGPREKIGEGSGYLGKALGPGRGEMDLVWICYPNSHHTPAWPVSLDTINEEGGKRFDAFGGLDKVKELFPGKTH